MKLFKECHLCVCIKYGKTDTVNIKTVYILLSLATSVVMSQTINTKTYIKTLAEAGTGISYTAGKHQQYTKYAAMSFTMDSCTGKYHYNK